MSIRYSVALDKARDSTSSATTRRVRFAQTLALLFPSSCTHQCVVSIIRVSNNSGNRGSPSK